MLLCMRTCMACRHALASLEVPFGPIGPCHTRTMQPCKRPCTRATRGARCAALQKVITPPTLSALMMAHLGPRQRCRSCCCHLARRHATLLLLLSFLLIVPGPCAEGWANHRTRHVPCMLLLLPLDAAAAAAAAATGSRLVGVRRGRCCWCRRADWPQWCAAPHPPRPDACAGAHAADLRPLEGLHRHGCDCGAIDQGWALLWKDPCTNLSTLGELGPPYRVCLLRSGVHFHVSHALRIVTQHKHTGAHGACNNTDVAAV